MTEAESQPESPADNSILLDELDEKFAASTRVSSETLLECPRSCWAGRVLSTLVRWLQLAVTAALAELWTRSLPP